MQLETKVSIDPFLQTHHFLDTFTSSLSYRQFSWLKSQVLCYKIQEIKHNRKSTVEVSSESVMP